MRKNGRLFIVLGVGLACLAVALAFLMFQNAGKSSAVEKAPVPVKIVVAAKDVPAHQLLRETDLAEIDKDLLVGADFIATRSEVLGLAPKTGLVKGQRLKKNELEVSGLTNDIAPGKRAVTINVDRLQTANGLLRDSDYIDLIFSTKVNLTYIMPTRPYEIETATSADTGSGTALTLPGQAPGDPAPYVYPGEPGSRFKIQGEKKGDPLAKVILQDIKVLRIIAATPPAQGQQQQQQQAVRATWLSWKCRPSRLK